MLTPEEVIKALKPQTTPGEDFHTTIEEICRYVPGIRDEIVRALVDLYDITITNSAEGGLMIPKKYFK